MPRPGHETDYVARRQTGRPSRARYGVSADEQEVVRFGDRKSVAQACDDYFRRKNLNPEPLVFGRADLRRSA